MATYNTPSDSANTAIRAFLTSVGEYYLGRKFDTGSGEGKRIWTSIKLQDFANECAYCGKKGEHAKLEIEHLIMFNREQNGLHHPGNVVPVCSKCNKRKKDPETKKSVSWEEQLRIICEENNESALFNKRKDRIERSIEQRKYPNLDANEKHAIRVIAESLYENIKTESKKSLELYQKLEEAFVKNKI